MCVYLCVFLKMCLEKIIRTRRLPDVFSQLEQITSFLNLNLLAVYQWLFKSDV